MRRSTATMFLFATGLAVAGPVAAQQSVSEGVRPAAPGQVAVGAWQVVSDQQLDRIRGGFDTGNGMLISFGIARQVFLNGSLIASTRVQIPDVAHMTAQQASALVAATRANVVQIGPDNRFDPGSLRQTTGATVIQNSLDNQRVQTLTTLDASVNNLDLFRSLNLQDSVQSALINSRAQ